jgi:hypothetical protein
MFQSSIQQTSIFNQAESSYIGLMLRVLAKDGHQGIKTDAASIGILASGISVQYRSIPVPDWFPLFRYQTG